MMTVTREVSRLGAVTLAPAADAAGALRRERVVSQSLGLEQLPALGVRRALEEPIVPVPDILEVMHLLGWDKHGEGECVNSRVAPLEKTRCV